MSEPLALWGSTEWGVTFGGGQVEQFLDDGGQSQCAARALLPLRFRQQRQVFGLTEDGEKAGQVSPAGDGGFGLDADEQSEGGVAAEFFQTRFGGRVAGDGQEQDAPQDGHGGMSHPWCRRA